MQARRAAREMALLALFQLEEQAEAGKSRLPSTIPQAEAIEALLRDSVHALVDLAKDKLETAADHLQKVSYALQEYQFIHPDNLEAPMHAPQKAVPLPTSKEALEQIDQCLKAADLLWEALKIPHLSEYSRNPAVRSYAVQLVQTSVEHAERIDSLINRYSTDWKLNRMVKMDRTLLRLALAEMVWVDDVDLSVTINEIVELAKLFSLDESYKFINGILGQVVEDIKAGNLNKAGSAVS